MSVQTTYRIYPLDGSGRIQSPIDLDCEGDTAAIAAARELGLKVRHGCELWHVTRFVGRFHFAAPAPEIPANEIAAPELAPA